MDEPVSQRLSQKYKNAASWHSEKEVYQIFDKKWTVVNKHVLVPSFEEVGGNPRSRSAKLRCARKSVKKN
jgi:16S rRNA C1402 N4-methylase RsmH